MNISRTVCATLIAGAVISSSGPALAQVEAARAEIARESATASRLIREPRSETSGVAPLPSAEANAEFGEMVVIQKQAAFDPWRVEFDIQGDYTDNVALAPRRVDDYILRAGVEASYLNRIAGNWSAEITLGQDFVRYDQYDSLDFDMSKVSAGVATKLPWLGNATLLARYQFEYLTESGFGSRILSSQSMTFGLIKSWKVADGQRLYLGFLSEPDISVDPEISLRHENGLYAGWSVKLTEKLTARLAGRASYYSSPNADRHDWNYQARISATYALTDWASIGASSSMMWNHSSRNRYDYRNLLAGAFVGMEIQF